jgi:hypothetical protein
MTVDPVHRSARPGPVWPWLILLIVVSGCVDESPPFTEVKRPDERITQVEWAAFRRVCNALPHLPVPSPEPVFPETPDWPGSRTLPICDLVGEEQRDLELHWSVARWARLLKGDHRLERHLRREQMTLHQFCGMLITLGTAVARTQLSEDFPLTQQLAKAEAIRAALRKDNRVFSSLPSEQQFDVLRDAAWVTRADLMERLLFPPEENLRLVRQHDEWLRKLLPAEFFTDRKNTLIDQMSAEGVPFFESPDVGEDWNIVWDPATAVRITGTTTSADSSDNSDTPPTTDSSRSQAPPGNTPF